MPTEAAAMLVILGAGGHGRVVADAALAQGRWRCVVVTDRDAQRCRGELLLGVPLRELQTLAASGTPCHVAIGDGRAREREATAWGAEKIATVVHPRAVLSPHARVETGCFIAAQAVVAPGAALGIAVIVNHGAVIDHDVQVGAFSHIAPLASLSGGARVGSHVLVGTGAHVLPGVAVADRVTIGAGAVVAAPIVEPGVYVGVPARRIR